MRVVRNIVIIMIFYSTFICQAKADTITFSSNNLNFSQPINLISDPSTTIQLGYNFPLYQNWLYMDLRGRTAQQNDSKIVTVNSGTSIVTEKISFMPSFDAGVRIQIKKNNSFLPYLFSLLDYTTVNLTSELNNTSVSEDISNLGLKIGFGTDLRLDNDSKGWLFNIDTGYQYIPTHICNTNINGMFFNIGFGLNF